MLITSSFSLKRFSMDGEDVPRSNFDSFWKALITVFQVQHCMGFILVSSRREAMRHVVEAVAQN